MLAVRAALLLVLASCAPKESARAASSSRAAEQPAASSEPAPSAASASATASASASTSAPPDPTADRAWQTVRAACADGVFVSQPTFIPQLGGLPTFQYFRFYQGGVVVFASVTDDEPGVGRAQTNAKVMRWLNPDHPMPSKGTYRIEGEKVVADLKVNAQSGARLSVEADFRKPPFTMKTVASINGNIETLKYACPQ